MSNETKPLSKKNAIKIYNQLDEEGKKLFEKEFGKDFLTDIDLSFEAACKKMKLHPMQVLPYKKPDNKREIKANANMKLDILREAHGNYPGINDRKYFPVFKMTSSGLVFSFSDCEFWYSYSYATVGAPFVFKTSDEATDFGRNHIELYSEIFIK